MIRALVIRFLTSVLALTMLALPLAAQLSPERTALNSMRKQNWQKAEAALRKGIRKDSANAIIDYLSALYFLDAANPSRSIDSSHHYALRSRDLVRHAEQRTAERLRRFPLDTTMLSKLITRIDSVAFEEAKRVNTEASYGHFLTNFPTAAEHNQASELRDAAAFLDAMKLNTYGAYLSFLTKYPSSLQAPEAKSRYEKLLFESKTKSKKLKDYIQFSTEYPTSPFASFVDRQIFELTTAEGTAERFAEFLSRYPSNRSVKHARNIQYYLLQESGDIHALSSVIDSLRTVREKTPDFVVPILANGKFGFMDNHGVDVVAPTADEIDDEYLCGNIAEDILVLPDRVVSSSGVLIYKGVVKTVDDLGYGFMLVETETGKQVVHKSGFVIPQTNLSAAKVCHGFLALKTDKWGLFTLAGRMILQFMYDDMAVVTGVLSLKKDNKILLATPAQLAAVADQESLKTQDRFDDVKEYSNMLWVRVGDNQGLLDSQLNIVIPLQKRELSPVFIGYVSGAGKSKIVFDLKGEEVGEFQKVSLQKPWVGVKRNSQWQLLHVRSFRVPFGHFDSLSFVGPFAIGHQHDTLEIYNNPDHFFELVKATAIEFVPGKDSVFFLSVVEGDKRALYNAVGKRLFSGDYDRIQYAGKDVFIVVKKEKKALVDRDGKLLLPMEYDAIGAVTDGMVTVLKSMKFGLFHVREKKLIKPQFDKNIVPYNDQYVVAYSNGKYALIDWNEKTKETFEYGEIRYWNDSLAWGKKDFQWILFNYQTKHVVLDHVKDYKLVSETKKEKIAIIHQNNQYGVWSSITGVIIPINFSDIRNVGAPENPIYFTEKHVEEASLFVVIYYTKDATLLRRYVYEADDYERIYCSDK